MALKYRGLTKHPLNMSAAELLAELEGLSDSGLMRSLLMAELAAIRQGEKPDSRTMRGLWYSLIKPALSRAGKLHEKTSGGKDKAWDARLSLVLAELVEIGETTYEEMCIIDGSRLRQSAVALDWPISNVRVTGAHYPNVLLCSEKDTIYSVISRIASLYGVSCYSGGGQPSKAATENLVFEIIRSPAYQAGSPLIILSLTDYDPAGYSIANSFLAQVKECLRGQGIRVIHQRLGIHPDQLTRAELEQSAYVPKADGLEAWLEETGGIHGQALGLELDALPLARVRTMFCEGIEQVITLEARKNDLRRAALELAVYELLMPELEARAAGLIQQAEAAGIVADLRNAPVSDALFRQAAQAGYEALNPLELNLFDSDALRAKLRALQEATP